MYSYIFYIYGINTFIWCLQLNVLIFTTKFNQFGSLYPAGFMENVKKKEEKIKT